MNRVITDENHPLKVIYTNISNFEVFVNRFEPKNAKKVYLLIAFSFIFKLFFEPKF
jgi:hypothetical protein